MKIHEKLKYLRIKNGYTQAEVAHAIASSRTNYVYCEQGRYSLSVHYLKRICLFYNIPYDWLIDDDIEII